MDVNANECAAVQLQEPVNGCGIDCGCPHWNRLQELRSIRLYHWNLAIKITAYVGRVELKPALFDTRKAKQREDNLFHLKRAHATHMTFVQILNQFFDIGDTAEKDAAK